MHGRTVKKAVAAVESPGLLTAGAHFLNIGLSCSEVDALKKVEGWLWACAPVLSMIQTIRLLVQVTLAHYDIVHSFFLKAQEQPGRELPSQWFSVRFTEVEIEALNRVNRGMRSSSLAGTARLLVTTALDNYSLLTAPMKRDVRYIDLERFDCASAYFEGIIKSRFARGKWPLAKAGAG